MYGFTFIQIMKYRRYEQVRVSGEFNMWSPQAQRATGLTDEDYIFVMSNFAELQSQEMEEERELTMTSNLANQFDVHF